MISVIWLKLYRDLKKKMLHIKILNVSGVSHSIDYPPQSQGLNGMRLDTILTWHQSITLYETFAKYLKASVAFFFNCKIKLHTWIQQWCCPFLTTGGSCSKRQVICSSVKELQHWLTSHNTGKTNEEENTQIAWKQ